ncbi:transporter substrate-binding domain-containing protein [Agromyces sp. NPDC058484]|uniref:transporter substrate-binding domain-containing protein n=1 Tax=Agromyces sp. NPDC058484 TaxID=3346524 RepID=UPI0036468326
MGRVRGLLAVIAATAVVLSGCSIDIPVDPHGTLDRVRDGSLRVGVSHNPPWTDITEGRSPSGIEPELIVQFAEELDAEIEWTEDGESTLAIALERGELDVVIGGLLENTPWTARAAVTRPYAETTGDGGRSEKHVMLVRKGENAFLVELEEFLDREGRR